MQMVGMGTTHAHQGIGAGRQRMIQDVFELAPFVAGNDGMQ